MRVSAGSGRPGSQLPLESPLVPCDPATLGAMLPPKHPIHFPMKTPIFLILLAPVLQAAPILRLTDDGIVITEDGIKTVLAFPSIAVGSGQPAKPSEKSTTDTSATLTYNGGGKIQVSILGGDITYTTTGLSEGTTHLVFSAPIDPKSVEGGKYRFDRKTIDFPGESGAGEATSSAEAKTFGILPGKGPGLSFTFATDSKHQLIDARQASGKDFIWRCSVPLKSGKDVISLQIAGGEPASLLPVTAPQAAE